MVLEPLPDHTVENLKAGSGGVERKKRNFVPKDGPRCPIRAADASME
jgi:hypothetical protein